MSLSPASSARARRQRTDGDSTRAVIAEAAGRLFAQRGYEGTTSKAICESAGVNLAAINYHFGSRDGMYLEVLRLVHERIVSMAFVRQVVSDTREPREKLRMLLRALVRSALDADNWAIRVWAREVLSPSPLLSQIMRENTQPKFDAAAAILAEITGWPVDDARMPRLVLSVISPCLLLLICNRDEYTPIQGLYGKNPDDLADALWRFAVAGLDGMQAR